MVSYSVFFPLVLRRKFIFKLKLNSYLETNIKQLLMHVCH
jgi:hypothetical protein